MSINKEMIVKRLFILTAIALCTFTAFQINAKSPTLKRELAKLSSIKGSFSFAVMGDNRSGDRVYKKIVHLIMVQKPLFVVNTGDVIPNPGNREQWTNFRNVSSEITVPYFLAPGNHDIDDKKSEEVWRDEVDLPGNETYYSFTVGKNLFVILNSCEPENDMRISGAQLSWLSSTLDPKRYIHQFVFLHHPVFILEGKTNTGNSLDKYPSLRDELHALFVARKVTAVFEGHEHTYSRMEKDGVAYIITGGGGAPLYGKDSFNNFMIVDVDGKRVGAKVIDRDGVLLREFVIGG